MAYAPQTISSLGGLNEDENPSAVKVNQLRIATNCSRRGSMTGTRPGVVFDTEYTAAISGTPTVQGLHEFRASRDATRHLVSVAGSSVYHDSTSGALNTSGAPTITSGADNVWTMAQYQNILWAAGGLHGTDTIWSWDGDTDNPVTNRASILPSMSPKYVFQKFNALFFGGFDGSSITDNPMLARYVDYATDATQAINWPASNSIPGVLLGENPGIGTFGEEYNSGFGSYQDNKGDFLLFLTNRRIVSFLENPFVSSNANRFVESDAIANGCVDQRAFVDLGYDQGDAVYVSEDGIHSMALSQNYGNRENTFLSWPIRKTWGTLNKNRLKFITADYWPDEGIILFSMSTGSNTTNNLILVMDIQGAKQITPDTVRWYKWFLNGISPNVIRAARTPDGTPTIYFGGTSGEVAPFTRAAYSDLGSAISTKFRTKDEDFNFPSIEKSIGDGFVSVSGAGGYDIEHSYILDDATKSGISTAVAVDNSGSIYGTGLYGTAVYGSDETLARRRIRGVGSAFTISHQFSHSADNEPFWVGQITQDISSQGQADEASS